MADNVHEKRLYRVNASGRVRPHHSSPKLVGPGYCESMFESSVYFAMDLDPSIVQYRVQPISFEFLKSDGSGKTRRYTPDTALLLENMKKEFVEIKPEAKVTDELVADLADFNRQLITRGLPLVRLVTEKDYSNTARMNAKKIMHFHKVKRDRVLQALMGINAQQIRYFGELKHQLDAIHPCYALACLAHQFATINLDSPLTDNSSLSWTGGRRQ